MTSDTWRGMWRGPEALTTVADLPPSGMRRDTEAGPGSEVEVHAGHCAVAKFFNEHSSNAHLDVRCVDLDARTPLLLLLLYWRLVDRLRLSGF
jgi:hypothetical protein